MLDLDGQSSELADFLDNPAKKRTAGDAMEADLAIEIADCGQGQKSAKKELALARERTVDFCIFSPTLCQMSHGSQHSYRIASATPPPSKPKG